MKYIFADCLDTVDPEYNFIDDRHGSGRDSHWSDHYPHELMATPPYDGILVSRGIVGDHKFPGKYTNAQAMRFRRLGARNFLRLNKGNLVNLPIFGDCGAFSYVGEPKPPYSTDEILEFYSDAGFTHGCSVDHIIFDFDREESGLVAGSEDARFRFEITLENASEFIKNSKALGSGFTPIGVAQGWSPSSIAESAKKLEDMGYSYIAIGGIVPLRVEDIHRCLSAVRNRISIKTRIHLLGFAKADYVDDFVKYNIESFDSTSPLIRAFKDARANYYVESDKKLEYYSAIRIPQSLENNTLSRFVKAGKINQDDLIKKESRALNDIRGFDLGKVDIEEVVESVSEYGSLLATDPSEGSFAREKLRENIKNSTRKTLSDQPWKKCKCSVCTKISIEVVIFRSSNRNRRRGFHNLSVYYDHVKKLINRAS